MMYNHKYNLAAKVYDQLLPDYPASSLQWIKKVPWTGPVRIPLDKIDFSHQHTWRADKERDKVLEHTDIIKEGESTPIILVELPEHPKFECIDGHHRLLAFQALNESPLAYVAHVDSDHPDSPWLTLHSKQYRGDSKLKLDGTGGKV